MGLGDRIEQEFPKEHNHSNHRNVCDVQANQDNPVTNIVSIPLSVVAMLQAGQSVEGGPCLVYHR